MATEMQTKTIVIVEDDQFVRSFLAAVIVHATPYQLLLFSSIGEALTQINNQQPDLLILDHDVEDMKDPALYHHVQAITQMDALQTLLIGHQLPFDDIA